MAGFPEEMGFQIWQTRSATLQQAMEAALNYKNAAQNYKKSAESLRKSLRGSEKREKSKNRRKDRKNQKRGKHSDSSSTSSSSSSSGVSFVTDSSDSDQGTSSGKRGSRYQNQKDKRSKEPVKIKLEDNDEKAVMKKIADALEAIKVNLADNWKPRHIVSTSRANVWCSRFGESGHFSSECYKGPQGKVHLVDPEIGVYYSVLEEEVELEVNPIFRVQPVYGRGKRVSQVIRADVGARPL